MQEQADAGATFHGLSFIDNPASAGADDHGTEKTDLCIGVDAWNLA
jgi:hypothetical protein